MNLDDMLKNETLMFDIKTGLLVELVQFYYYSQYLASCEGKVVVKGHSRSSELTRIDPPAKNFY